MVVEEMNILTTIFLKANNEKVYYPNTILATKAISNYNRSPEMMGDAIDFAVDFSTSVEKLAALRAKIKGYACFSIFSASTYVSNGIQSNLISSQRVLDSEIKI